MPNITGTTFLTGGLEVATGIMSGGRNTLFLTALANLEWSRGYSWYVELDDVPNPFHRGGVLGLPVTDITYDISQTDSFEWESGMTRLSVPKSKGLCEVNMTMYDDEQGTMVTFFERWFNSIYNARAGVLPVTEAAKCLSVYKLNSLRTPVKRYTKSYDINTGVTDALKAVPSRDFLVYPIGPLQENEKIDSNPRTYQIQLRIVNEQNADFGDASEHETMILGKVIKAGSFIGRAADYF